ncbi:hypothetical protein EUX98_g6535 [Antrodiella citrinella]|uniref:Cytochrome P450 n=1 Tax=Antrodiella citrinella TaxID=2447956 RepID=A0A4S4MPJ8_9APHY|nr:hypothetical protein EUX98_g6535 [Antrodiella citrinella]
MPEPLNPPLDIIRGTGHSLTYTVMGILWFQAFTNIFLAAGLYVIFRKLTDLEAEGSYEDVGGPPKDHWLKGSFHRMFYDGFDFILRNIETYGGIFKYAGPFWMDIMLVSDPLAMYHILVKDQEIFEMSPIFQSGNYLVFGPGLFATSGDQHRKQRKMLNPAFSTSNMQDMLPAIQPIAQKLCASLTSQISRAGGMTEIDTLEWMSRTSIEYIAQAGMGYSFDSLDNNNLASDYVQALKQIVPLNMRLRPIRMFTPFMTGYISQYWRNKIVDVLPIPALKEMRRCTYVLYSTSKQILAERKADMEREMRAQDVEDDSWATKIKGKDIMSILLRANASAHEMEKLSEEEVLSQMSGLLFAGFETTSSTLSRILHTLALDDYVQSRLRTEIKVAKQHYATFQSEIEPDREVRWEDVELPYDILMGMPYLDAILREILRLYPPAGEVGRVAKVDTQLPLQFPIRCKSGVRMKVVPIPKGTNIGCSILGANYNKEIWGEDAFEFKPERWLTDPSGDTTSRASRAGKTDDDFAYGGIAPGLNENTPGVEGGVRYPGVYSSIMTFGGGPRACIGFRFAEMEIKQVLTTLLSTLHFSPSPDKEIRWMYNNFQTPVVRPPAGDGKTRQVPLNIRMVNRGDFVAK